MLNTLQLQALLVPKLPKSDSTRREVSRLALKEGSYGCPSLLPENKLNCLGNEIPPTVPVEHSGQRKMIEQRV